MKKAWIKNQKDKGASLVLVIICMLFVGIIAAAVLTLTTGNIDSVKTGRESTGNFYSAESVLDAVKSFLQQKANDAATKAYAKTLSEMAGNPGLDKVEAYKTNFETELKSVMKEQCDETKNGSLAWMCKNSNYTLLGIAADDEIAKYFTLVVPNDESQFEASNGVGILKGITIDFVDADKYRTLIDTDLQFTSEVPWPTWDGSGALYEYNIDKYVMISEGGINGDCISGNIEGSIYSGDSIDIKIDSSSVEGVAGDLFIDAQNIIAKNDINISNGNLYVYGLGSKFGANGEEKKYCDLITKNLTATVSTTQPNANIWANGINLISKNSYMKLDNDVAKVYLKDDLSLNGVGSSFMMTKGDFYGFSEGGSITDEADIHKASSAIVMNGVDSCLDLSGLSSVSLAGTVYTDVPAIDNDNREDKQELFFVQGESVTFKSLQSLYLVPDKAIKGVGHNIMNEAEYARFEGVDLSKVSDYIKDNVKFRSDTMPYRVATVRFTGTNPQIYFYIFWNFNSTDDAVNYFNNVKGSDLGAAIGTKIQMIGSGSIKLPNSKVYTKGDIILYNGGSYGYRASNWTTTNSTESSTIGTKFKNIVSSLDESEYQGTSLFNTLFAAGNISKASDLRDGTELLKGPTAWSDEDYTYTGYLVGADGAVDGTPWKYSLITGDDITLSSIDGVGIYVKPDTKYVVVSNGNVTVNSGTVFNGIIIARGEIKVGANVTLNCFGNYSRTRVSKDDSTDVMSEYVSELDALLAVSVDGDSDGENLNTILRQIFGIAGSTNAGFDTSGQASDIAKVGTTNYKKN